MFYLFIVWERYDISRLSRKIYVYLHATWINCWPSNMKANVKFSAILVVLGKIYFQNDKNKKYIPILLDLCFFICMLIYKSIYLIFKCVCIFFQAGIHTQIKPIYLLDITLTYLKWSHMIYFCKPLLHVKMKLSFLLFENFVRKCNHCG